MLDKFMEDFSDLFRWCRPQAGTIGFVNCLFTDDAEQFCLDLLTKRCSPPSQHQIPVWKRAFPDRLWKEGFSGRVGQAERICRRETLVLSFYLAEHIMLLFYKRYP